MRIHTGIPTILAAALLGVTVPASTAGGQCENQRPNGYCPETTLRTGEVPIWQQQFKGAHNAFQLSENLADQIDDYNNWCIELDIHYQDGEIIVEHHCADHSGRQAFLTSVLEISLAVTAYDKVTFIYLNKVDDGVGFDCYDEWPANYLAEIRNALLVFIPEDRFYTHFDFVNTDNRTWPSMKELVRRGQNFVVTIDGIGGHYFFDGGDVVALEGGCDGGGTPDPWTPDPSQLGRLYPSSSCSQSCGLQNDGYFEDGVTGNFTFITNNCVDDADCVDYRIHSPQPYFVVRSGSPSHQWGTRAFPRVGVVGLQLALLGASPMVDVLVGPGDYALSTVSPGGEARIDRPMVIRPMNNSGDVTIR